MARKSRSIVELSAIVPPDIFVGTSLILRQGVRFLYGIRPTKIEGEDPILELTGIGGGLEEYDQTYSAGVLRESLEEIGSPVQLLTSEETVVVRGPDRISWVEIAGPERPLALVFRNYRTPAHSPWDEDNQGSSCLLVFMAELKEQPEPREELPNLIWLSAEQVLETARRDVYLSFLLMGGAQLVEGRFGPPPLDGLARLTDSQEALALALGDQLVDLYLGR